MKYDQIKRQIKENDNQTFKYWVQEGLDKFVEHFANVSPLFIVGPKVTGDTYDKLVNLLFHKQLGVNGRLYFKKSNRHFKISSRLGWPMIAKVEFQRCQKTLKKYHEWIVSDVLECIIANMELESLRKIMTFKLSMAKIMV